MTDSVTDAEHWRVALLGDREGFGVIFDRHQHRVFRHSIALVPTMDDARDVVAVAFLEAWRRRASVRFVDGSLLPWLLVTATHAAQNISRSARRYRALLERVPPSAAVPDPADAFEDTPAMAALGSLPRGQQYVVTLCIIEGLTLAEAADVLRIPVGTVKSRLHAAKRTLASRLGQPRTSATLNEAFEGNPR